MKQEIPAMGETSALTPTSIKALSLSIREREHYIFKIKNLFEQKLSHALNLQRISAPLFVDKNSGLQDNLNGVERPVSFTCKALEDRPFEIVQSLAKWKRMALKEYGFIPGEGIVTDMRALRPDEDLNTPIHSIYVDQWDWEKVITAEERHLETLKQTVTKIYQAIYETHLEVSALVSKKSFLPPDITFIHAEELLSQFPHLSPKQREHEICKKFGAVFIIGIGDVLSDGKPHDLRAPDYDDWTTAKGLNGDILVWNPILNDALELSSMGIRVDEKALQKQLALRGCEDRALLPWHDSLLKGMLPLTIGGGIGQSRLCMFILQCHHIKEVQISVWA